MGIAYRGTGYSLLIVGLLHASFNASASTKLDVFDGDWQQIAALIILLGVIAAARRLPHLRRGLEPSRLTRAPRADGQPPI